MTRMAQIESLQIDLLTNPRSLSFSQLADLYIAENMIDEADTLLQRSLSFHPHSLSGNMLRGRLLQLKNKWTESAEAFSFCIARAPDNWMCLLLRAQSYLKMNQSQKAMVDFENVVTLNPQHLIANKALAKLKSQSQNTSFVAENTSPTEDILQTPLRQKMPAQLERVLSLVDALSSRQNYQKSLQLLKECQAEFGAHEEIKIRFIKLSQHENAEKIRPKIPEYQSISRRHLISQKQINTLEILLRRIASLNNRHSLV